MSFSGEIMEIVSLDKKEYDYYPLEYRYETEEYYKVSVNCGKEGFGESFERQRLEEKLFYENTDTLFQEYWNNPKAFGVKDDSGEIIAFLEFDTEEWNNRLVMTQLLVKDECRGKGVGRMLFDFVKDYARREEYRIITLETQNINTPAIDFYLKMGFTFCGTNLFFYSNDDIGENEVMIEMAYLVD
jgi:ribosomal protein S18 acetylase RimI-like enzyme